MMYLKQFPDICREMGLAMKENSKIVTLSVPDICYSIAMMHFTREKYLLIIKSAVSRCAMLFLWALCAKL